LRGHLFEANLASRRLAKIVEGYLRTYAGVGPAAEASLHPAR
jgi:hypothetical protein